MDERLVQTDRELLGDVLTSQEAWNNLVALCDRFGSRFGGTEAEKGARDYLLDKMVTYGLDNPHPEEFSYTGWARGSASLEILSPVTQELPCISLIYTGSCDVEGELVYVGHGTPADFESMRDQIPGRIVMVSAWSPSYFWRRLHRGEKLARATALGAKGFLWMRWEGGLLPETGAANFNGAAEIPCIGLAREHGEFLNRLARSGPVRVRLRTVNQIRPGSLSWNVVGDLAGTTWPEEVIIVGAHFDGHDISQGAIDDGSGAVIVLEIARVLARYRHHLGRSLRFVCFSLEEFGLIGSYAYAKAHRDEAERFKFMLNLDSAGYGTDGAGIQLTGDRTELVQPFRAAARSIGQDLVIDNGLVTTSDHFPFFLEGVPCGSYMRMGPAPGAGGTGLRGWGHTAADTLDKVSPATLRSVSALLARFVLRLSNLPEWPARGQTQDEIIRILDDYRLSEVLKMENRYPF